MRAGTYKAVAKGKTKGIFQSTSDSRRCKIVSFDDVTAGNGKRHEVIPGKGKLSTRTTINVFRLLKRQHIPVAYRQQDSPNSFIADYCVMIPLEIVGRFRVDEKSSYLKRNPGAKAGEPFVEPVVEFYLKTSGKKWKDLDLPCDDPFLLYRGDLGFFEAYLPNKPLDEQDAITRITLSELGFQKEEEFERVQRLAKKVNIALKGGFDAVKADLTDFKWEAGVNPFREIVVADVIDADSIRLKYAGREISKQLFRDGADAATVEAAFATVAWLTDHFPQ